MATTNAIQEQNNEITDTDTGQVCGRREIELFWERPKECLGRQKQHCIDMTSAITADDIEYRLHAYTLRSVVPLGVANCTFLCSRRFQSMHVSLRSTCLMSISRYIRSVSRSIKCATVAFENAIFNHFADCIRTKSRQKQSIKHSSEQLYNTREQHLSCCGSQVDIRKQAVILSTHKLGVVRHFSDEAAHNNEHLTVLHELHYITLRSSFSRD